MENSELLRITGLSADWAGSPVLRDVSFTVHEAEYVVLMGPNGSGKTTLLRCLAGFEPPVAGNVVYRGRSLDRVPSHRRGMGFLLQDPALFSDRSVAENIGYGLEVAGWDANSRDRRVGTVAEVVGVRNLLARDPETLSGGERQRVALARTLAPGPALILLDEPFGSLDVEVQRSLRIEFRRTLRRMGVAAIHVTHDREEGLFLGDRVALLFGGRLAAIGPPAEVFEHPESEESARFLGYNLLDEGGRLVAVHPSDVRIRPAEGARASGTVASVGPVGRELVTFVELGPHRSIEVRRPLGAPSPGVGETVGIEWAAGRLLGRPADGRSRER